jgi:hypothetical protein
MLRSNNEQLENRLLYDYIQLAFRHVKKFSSEDVTGDPKSFISNLYLQRTLSIFEGYIQAPQEERMEFDQYLNWFRSEQGKMSDDMFEGDLKGLWINPNTAEVFFQNDHPEFRGRNISHDSDRLGIEAFATYLPIHFFLRSESFSTEWGIYISESGIAQLGCLLQECFESHTSFGPVKKEKKHHFLEIAYQILLRHELTHYRIELFALNAELTQHRPLYVPYLNHVYASLYESPDCFEEALANSSVLNSNVIRDLVKELYPDSGTNWSSIVENEVFQRQPPGYSDYHFNRTKLLEPSGENFNGKRGGSRSVTPRALAMNYLCNQIVLGNIGPFGEDEIPFFAALPDNYFLRAENLVPIHVVPALNEQNSFIQLTPPREKLAERMLYDVGYYPSELGNGDHKVWEKPGWGRITINYIKGELDPKSRNNMRDSFGLTEKEFRLYQTTKRMPASLSNRLNAPNQQRNLF